MGETRNELLIHVFSLKIAIRLMHYETLSTLITFKPFVVQWELKCSNVYFCKYLSYLKLPIIRVMILKTLYI